MAELPRGPAGALDDGPQGVRADPQAADSRDGGGLSLGPAAARLYGDLRLSRILGDLLDQSAELLDAVAGSVSVVDAVRDRYRKAAERGASCQLGRTFPLDEGITGQVAWRRSPVVLARYSDVPGGHLPASHPAASGAAAAVPIWWRGDILGVNVVFAGRDRAFTAREVDQLELLSQVAAAGIVSTAPSEPALADVLAELNRDDVPARAPLVVTEVGAQEHRHHETTRTAEQVLGLLEQATAPRSPAGRLRVVLLHGEDRLRVVVHDDAPALPPCGGSTGGSAGGSAGATPDTPRPAWAELVVTRGGELTVERVPGWGVLVLADLPHRPVPREPTPLSPRQQEVLALLAQGLSDRQVAQELVLTPKTVEKHVSAVLRKTGATSRTAAVVRAIENGWLSPGGPGPAH